MSPVADSSTALCGRSWPKLVERRSKSAHSQCNLVDSGPTLAEFGADFGAKIAPNLVSKSSKEHRGQESAQLGRARSKLGPNLVISGPTWADLGGGLPQIWSNLARRRHGLVPERCCVCLQV